MFNMKCTGRVERDEVTALEKRVETLEALYYGPRLEKLLEEYRNYVPVLTSQFSPRVAGSRIIQYNGFDYSSWTEEEFIEKKLNPLKAKALDDHKCPENTVFMGPESTYTISMSSSVDKPKRKRK